jgi:hypothetical protein
VVNSIDARLSKCSVTRNEMILFVRFVPLGVVFHIFVEYHHISLGICWQLLLNCGSSLGAITVGN